MAAWLYEYAKNHISKHSSVYSSYQTDIGSEAFNRASVTHQKAVISAVGRTSNTIGFDGREKEEMLKEDPKRNVTFCLHKRFCRNRELK